MLTQSNKIDFNINVKSTSLGGGNV